MENKKEEINGFVDIVNSSRVSIMYAICVLTTPNMAGVNYVGNINEAKALVNIESLYTFIKDNEMERLNKKNKAVNVKKDSYLRNLCSAFAKREPVNLAEVDQGYIGDKVKILKVMFEYFDFAAVDKDLQVDLEVLDKIPCLWVNKENVSEIYSITPDKSLWNDRYDKYHDSITSKWFIIENIKTYFNTDPFIEEMSGRICNSSAMIDKVLKSDLSIGVGSDVINDLLDRELKIGKVVTESINEIVNTAIKYFKHKDRPEVMKEIYAYILSVIDDNGNYYENLDDDVYRTICGSEFEEGVDSLETILLYETINTVRAERVKNYFASRHQINLSKQLSRLA